ncbi:hypothetical protein F5Y12DRAFT_709697 [Xylaria sp. FL1777]|nr:hypothetical protein F5Y12DRAFT_709697 [Xylaria sp. FL1777]
MFSKNCNEALASEAFIKHQFEMLVRVLAVVVVLWLLTIIFFIIASYRASKKLAARTDNEMELRKKFKEEEKQRNSDFMDELCEAESDEAKDEVLKKYKMGTYDPDRHWWDCSLVDEQELCKLGSEE